MELSWTVFNFWFLHQLISGNCYSYRPERMARIRMRREKYFDEGDKDFLMTLKHKLNGGQTINESGEYDAEKKGADVADMLSNVHHSYPSEFHDFGRRFVPQYPYFEVLNVHENRELVPVKASPEKVLAVAMQSAIAEAKEDHNGNSIDESVQKKLLRTGDYWDSVWVEEVDPSILRSGVKLLPEVDKAYRSDGPKLSSVKAKIMPGSKLYQLVSVLKQYSPRLLYVINNSNRKNIK